MALKRPSPTPVRPRLLLSTSSGTALAAIFFYLSGKFSAGVSARAGKQCAADAIRAFWHPIALKALGHDSKQVKAVAQQSVEDLQRQIRLICETCGLEMPQPQIPTAELSALVTALTVQLSSGLPAPVPPTSPVPVASSAAVPLPVQPVPEFTLNRLTFEVDDGELIGGLLE